MNKIGMMQGYWDTDWMTDYPKYIEKTARLGFDVFECALMCMIDLPKTKLEEIKKVARDNNIELSLVMGLSAEHDPASKDKNIRDATVDKLKELLEFVSFMDSKTLSGVIYGAWLVDMDEGDTDRRPYIDRSIDTLKKVVKTAEDLNINYSLEVLNRFEQYLFNTAKDCAEFIKRVDSPCLSVQLDTFHMNIEEDRFDTAIYDAGELLGHFHIGENNRKCPGQGGHIPWDEIFGALKKINYKNYIVMEPYVHSGGGVGKDIRVWADLAPRDMADMERRAKNALEFVRSKLAN